jgi:hypothetical protein
MQFIQIANPHELVSFYDLTHYTIRRTGLTGGSLLD